MNGIVRGKKPQIWEKQRSWKREAKKQRIWEMFYVTDMGNLKVADLGKRFFVVILLLIRLFLWFAADAFFYIAERFFRRRIWEIAGAKTFGRSWRSRRFRRIYNNVLELCFYGFYKLLFIYNLKGSGITISLSNAKYVVNEGIKMKRLGVLVLTAVIASAGIGVSYASFNDGYVIGGFPSCYCDVAFVGSVTAYDNEVTKFIGEVDAWLVDVDGDGLYDKVLVEIDHAYPGYVVYIDFTVENKGNRPINVNGIVLEGCYDHDGNEVTNVMSSSLSGTLSTITWLDASQAEDGTLVITVLNGAMEDSVYTFTVGLGFDSSHCQQPVLLETLTVPSDGSPVYSTTVLQDGTTYLLKAFGTYTYWPAQLLDAGIADAKYSLRPVGSYNPGPGPQWINGAALPPPYTNYLQIWIDGAPVSWGGDFNGDHIYTMHYPGADSSISFSIMDNNYGDNSESLMVQIYELT